MCKSLPKFNYKIFRIVHNNIDLTENQTCVGGRGVENIVQKVEMLVTSISPFCTMFSKGFLRLFTSQDCVVTHPDGSVMSMSDLVVVSWIPGPGNFSFWRIYASHLCRSMWEKLSVPLERKVVLILVWESQETHVRHRPPYDLSC